MPVEYLRPVDIAERQAELNNRFPMEMAVLKVGGVSPDSNSKWYNPYTNQTETESFANVGEHCIAVAGAAKTIGIAMGLTETDLKHITSRALVHDATKRFEVARKKAQKEGLFTDVYSPQAYESIQDALIEQGVAEQTVAYMVNAGKETGHNSLGQFIILNPQGEPVLSNAPLVDQIIHLADDMTYTSIPTSDKPAQTYYLTVEERMEAQNFREKYGFMFTEGLAFDESGSPVRVKSSEEAATMIHFKTYAEWQVWVADKISKNLVSMIPDAAGKDPQIYLKGLLNG